MQKEQYRHPQIRERFCFGLTQENPYNGCSNRFLQIVKSAGLIMPVKKSCHLSGESLSLISVQEPIILQGSGELLTKTEMVPDGYTKMLNFLQPGYGSIAGMPQLTHIKVSGYRIGTVATVLDPTFVKLNSISAK